MKNIEKVAEELYKFAQEQLGFNQPARVVFESQGDKAVDMFSPTANYNPTTRTIKIFVDHRHPKDILRSMAHELVHHAQCCEGAFEGQIDTSPGYAQKDDHMRNLERDAYFWGNGILFRDWEDDHKQKRSWNLMNEGKRMSINEQKLRQKVRRLIIENDEEAAAQAEREAGFGPGGASRESSTPAQRDAARRRAATQQGLADAPTQGAQQTDAGGAVVREETVQEQKLRQKVRRMIMLQLQEQQGILPGPGHRYPSPAPVPQSEEEAEEEGIDPRMYQSADERCGIAGQNCPVDVDLGGALQTGRDLLGGVLGLEEQAPTPPGKIPPITTAPPTPPPKPPAPPTTPAITAPTTKPPETTPPAITQPPTGTTTPTPKRDDKKEMKENSIGLVLKDGQLVEQELAEVEDIGSYFPGETAEQRQTNVATAQRQGGQDRAQQMQGDVEWRQQQRQTPGGFRDTRAGQLRDKAISRSPEHRSALAGEAEGGASQPQWASQRGAAPPESALAGHAGGGARRTGTGQAPAAGTTQKPAAGTAGATQRPAAGTAGATQKPAAGPRRPPAGTNTSMKEGDYKYKRDMELEEACPEGEELEEQEEPLKEWYNNTLHEALLKKFKIKK